MPYEARATTISCQWLMGTCSVNSVDLPDGSSCSSGVICLSKNILILMIISCHTVLHGTLFTFRCLWKGANIWKRVNVWEYVSTLVSFLLRSVQIFGTLSLVTGLRWFVVFIVFVYLQFCSSDFLQGLHGSSITHGT